MRHSLAYTWASSAPPLLRLIHRRAAATRRSCSQANPALVPATHAASLPAWASQPRQASAARAAAAAAVHAQAGPAPAPARPLCLRPAAHEAQLRELLSWREDVLAQIAVIGDTFADRDGGPGREELEREVTWVLEDVVAEVQEQGTRPATNSQGGDAGQGWVPCRWQHLEVEVRCAQQRGGALEGWRLKLRCPVAQLREMWRRRLQDREPFQYLISTAHWRNLILSVSPGVLIPRPETEIFPDLVAKALSALPELATAPWADLGTGSGAIAISTAAVLSKHSKGSPPSVWAVDLSPVAAAHARYNADLAGVSDSVHVMQGSWFEPLQHLWGQLGGVLSNPPYIPRAQMAGLQAEVGSHEPWSALDGGQGPGLDSLQVICEGAASMLRPGGFIALETAGQEQAQAVVDLLLRTPAVAGEHSREQALGTTPGVPAAEAEAEPMREVQRVAFENAEVVQDCFGVGRFVVAWRTRL